MRFATGFLILTLAAGGTVSPAGPRGKERPSPGLHRETLPLENGQVLRYALAAPPREAGKGRPLVLALHYGGEVTPYYGMDFLRILVAPALRYLDAYIVAPDCPGQGWTDPASERAVLALLDHALQRWPVDPERVVVTGFSMGGVGTWFLAGRHPERFSAAVPVAGQPVGEPDVRVPVFAVHSRQDEVVEAGPTVAAIVGLRNRGGTAELLLVEGPTHYRTREFVGPLSRAVAWLEQVWASGP
jgi:predicted peptidase